MRAAWRLQRKPGRAIIQVEPFEPMSRSARSELEEEAGGVGTLLDAEAQLEVRST